MIPVMLAQKPKTFDATVRNPGLAWLARNNIPLAAKLPRGTKLPPLWRLALTDLHTQYGGVCAYLCVFVERCTGGVSADHYVAKSHAAGRAYDWDNYRLACMTMNAKKRDFTTVLDPIGLLPGTFSLNLASGSISPGAGLGAAALAAASDTISRLGLDEPGPRAMRARHFTEYLGMKGAAPNPAVEAHLKRTSPFVWYEAQRLGLL